MDQMFCEKMKKKMIFLLFISFWGMKNDLLNVFN